MNIILISDERLKVVLTDTDLLGYGIRIEDIDYDNTETRRVFWTILDKAKSETGFDAATSRIFIQIYPDKRGGCEMYVSRLSERECLPKDTARVRFTVSKKTDSALSEYLYRFSDTEYLLAACRALCAMGFSDSSAAFAEASGRVCYLIIKSVSKWSLILSEYGEKCNGKYDKIKVIEHCAAICGENAVKILGAL